MTGYLFFCFIILGYILITLADRVFFCDDGWEMLWERAYETELSLSDSFYTFYGPSYDTESPTLS